MNIKKVCPFNKKPDASRRTLSEILVINNLSEQPVAGIEIKYPNKTEKVIVSFRDCDDGDFIGAFFEYIEKFAEEKTSGGFIFTWVMANDAWMCFGDGFPEDPPQLFEMFRRVRHREEVVIKIIHK